MTPDQTCARPRLATNDPGARGAGRAALVCTAVIVAQRPIPVHLSGGLAGYPGGQVINAGEERPQDRGRVRLVISDH